MSKNEKSWHSIFYPNYERKVERIEAEGTLFVHYTGAETAISIIENQEIWLRNAQCMNDYQEVHHGIECLIKAFDHEISGKKFKQALESSFSGITKEIIDLFDGWLPDLRTNTFIMCVSEHPPFENKYGRLSMWRAYGGEQSVALVLNKKPFYSETDIFHAYTHPVAYHGADEVIQGLDALADRILENQEFISSMGKDFLVAGIFEVFKTYALCTKHPGFSEEREWRLVYNPKMKKSKYVSSDIHSINGVPQEIHKIPLRDIPEGIFYGATIPEVLEKIIIGPNDNQDVIGKAFETSLLKAGCKDPKSRIHYSDIPLR